jgi:rhodanese-related sulfurtransferase
MMQVTAAQAQELIAAGDVEVIDVRDLTEWVGGHVPNARHVPLERLRNNAKAELSRDGVVFVCAAGIRSQIAARIAEGAGLKRVYNLSGGTQGWTRAGLPLDQNRSAA